MATDRGRSRRYQGRWPRWSTTASPITGKVPTPTDGPDAVVEAIAALIEETAAANDVEVTHVGIGAPGKVDREAGVLAHAPNLVGLASPWPWPTSWRRGSAATSTSGSTTT